MKALNVQKPNQRHWDENVTAEFLDLTVATLRDWRFHKVGPVYAKFGKAVRYPIDEVLKFAEQARVRTAA